MPRMDFDGDGRSDIFWVNLSAGYITNWLGQANGAFIHNVDALERISIQGTTAFGDFNGSGLTDLVQASPEDVYMVHTALNGVFWHHWFAGFLTANPPGTLIAAGDFNGDGRDDPLWRTSSGELVQWQFAGGWGNYAYTVNQAATQQLPAGWALAGVGDFNGDGRDDLLWRNDEGALSQWLGQTNGSFAWNPFAAHSLSEDWSIKAIGDFNGDGREDLLWRNADGAMSQWLGQANGSFAWNPAFARELPNHWQIVGSGDYNGDGRDDLLWRDSSGSVTNWLAQANGDFVSNHANAWYDVPLDWVPAHSTTGVVDWML